MVVAQGKVANFIPAPDPVVHTVLFKQGSTMWWASIKDTILYWLSAN